MTIRSETRELDNQVLEAIKNGINKIQDLMILFKTSRGFIYNSIQRLKFQRRIIASRTKPTILSAINNNEPVPLGDLKKEEKTVIVKEREIKVKEVKIEKTRLLVNQLLSNEDDRSIIEIKKGDLNITIIIH